jgi:hypothetical protein
MFLLTILITCRILFRLYACGSDFLVTRAMLTFDLSNIGILVTTLMRKSSGIVEDPCFCVNMHLVQIIVIIIT